MCMKSEPVYIRVLLNTPAKTGLFDYSVPPDLSVQVMPGQMAVVLFNRSVHQAVVWQVGVVPEVEKVFPIQEIVDPVPVMTEAQMKLAEKIAERFLAPLYECVNLLLTDKVRRISNPVYRLTDQNLAFQSSLMASYPGERGLIPLPELFREHHGELDEHTLNKVYGKKGWQSKMYGLLRSGLVKKSLRMEQGGTAPKSEPTAALCVDRTIDDDTVFSRIRTVDARRKAILTYLKEHGLEVFTVELKGETGANREDLQYLEKNGWITLQRREVWRSHRHYMHEGPEKPVDLTQEQAAAYEAIAAGLREEGPGKPVLLHGVTGSGKTEVYLRAAAEAIRRGKQVLMLVPEIALTPQILARFERRFPGRVGVYHSRLGDGERYDTWRRGRSGEFRVIVGPRSALAVPLPDLGLIIADECHEDSYYQANERPFFSAIRAASDYAEITGSQLVLGSATPTTAQMFKAERSGWQIETLRKRATGVRPPRVMLADMRSELKSGNSELFSRALMREIGVTLEMNKQTILFLNRRGTASYTFCHACGEALKCPNCDIPYTWHASRQRLECHYCGSVMELPERCPSCGSEEIRQFGAGVEMVEALIAEKFPAARTIRLDADTAEGVGNHEKLLSCFARHEADILIGTQMVAKGLDFPDVRLVGILLADVGANFHDYRVDEHTFQMLTQVAGRAGRAAEQGLAILQTYQPDRYSIRAAVSGDYERFYRNDLAYRRMMGYPPFSRLLRLEIRDADPDKARTRSYELAGFLKEKIREEKMKIRLIGPAPCFFPRLNGKYRWHIILRGTDPVRLIRPLDLPEVRIEVDPSSLL
ncbi:MAG: primosomal protein N' [Anaerolineaceae bacterium]|nr:primosomal protein N' [Anaerolineaceae bacterium]